MSNTREEPGREGLEGSVGLGMTKEEIEVWYELAAVASRMLQLPGCILGSGMRPLMTFIGSKIFSWGAPGFGRPVGPENRAPYV